MVFEILHESLQRGELTLIDGGMCLWHLRKDGQVTIRAILSTRPGAGKELLNLLKCIPGAKCIVAKCPADLQANAWYARRGFHKVRVELSRKGKELWVWRLVLNEN